MSEMSEYPYQGNSVEFYFEQEDNGWWTTNATQSSRRSEDGETWEIAEINVQILDKDTGSAIVTCWDVFARVNKECDGDLFNHKDSVVYIKDQEEE